MEDVDDLILVGPEGSETQREANYSVANEQSLADSEVVCYMDDGLNKTVELHVPAKRPHVSCSNKDQKASGKKEQRFREVTQNH